MDRLNILMVEDVPRDAEAIEDELRQENIRFSSHRVETREQFLAALASSRPDIVLSDFTLPHFNAMEALHLMRERRYDIPFILITGTRSEEVAVECIKEGADDYILKGSLKRLPSSILSVLGKKATEREKARAEEAFRRSEEQYRLIAENTRDLISLLDLRGHFLYASPSFTQVLGFRPEELISANSFAWIHPEDRAAVRQTWQDALHSREGRTVEFRARNRSQQWQFFEASGNWIFDPSGRPQRAVIVSRDITDRKRAEEALRSQSRLVTAAQEAERRRVARELHDSVNQILSSVKFRIRAVSDRVAALDDFTLREVQKAGLLLEKAMQEVRHISHNLRPSELDDLGLAAALRALCDEFSERIHLDLRLVLANLPDSLPGETELHLYRIVQEGLANIEKHSGARRVRVNFSCDQQSLFLVMQDDGRGFDRHFRASPSSRPAGMGLVDMHERALAIGGTCRIESVLGVGTSIYIRVPLPATSPPEHGKVKSGEKRKKEKDKIAARG